MHKQLLTSALLLTAVAAHAQTTTPSVKPITLKIGYSRPAQDDTNDHLGTNWFAAGAEYAFHSKNPSGVPYVFFDFTDHSHHWEPFNDVLGTYSIDFKATSYGVGVGLRTYSGHPKDTVRGYFDFGLGLYINRLTMDQKATGLYRTADDIPSRRTTGDLGYKLGAGVEIAGGVFAEVEYVNAGDVAIGNGYKPASFAATRFMAGVRF